MRNSIAFFLLMFAGGQNLALGHTLLTERRGFHDGNRLQLEIGYNEGSSDEGIGFLMPANLYVTSLATSQSFKMLCELNGAVRARDSGIISRQLVECLKYYRFSDPVSEKPRFDGLSVGILRVSRPDPLGLRVNYELSASYTGNAEISEEAAVFFPRSEELPIQRLLMQDEPLFRQHSKQNQKIGPFPMMVRLSRVLSKFVGRTFFYDMDQSHREIHGFFFDIYGDRTAHLQVLLGPENDRQVADINGKLNLLQTTSDTPLLGRLAKRRVLERRIEELLLENGM